ncbi:nitroreductase family protein [Streptococcus sobrinus]|uniref:nitroreductase family protein n=1 Tax=Streptococcus sobrinus TaxID=1310 RepID=UPI0039C0E8FE
METFLDFLDGRHSVRHFNPRDTLPRSLAQSILEHASQAPPGNNFQPWRVVVVRNKEKQAHLAQLAAGQVQVKDASAVFLVFGDKLAYDLDWWQEFHLQRGAISRAEVAGKLSRIEAYFKLHPEDKDLEGLRLDVGLFAMNLMHVVRSFGYDSVPMRGADFTAIKAYLQLPENWEPILMLPVGKALTPGYPHARRPVKDFTRFID